MNACHRLSPHSAGAALLALVANLGLLLAACTSSSASGPAGSFYLEATITVIDDRDSAPYAETKTRVKWWSESVERWRWELEQDAVETFEEVDSFSLSDGEAVWFYDAAENSYQRTVPFELPAEFTAMPFPSVVLFGPANHPSLDDLAGDFLSRGEDVEVFVGGTDTYLDAATTLLDYRPTWRERSVTATAPNANGDPTPEPVETTSSGGVGRMWVDEDRMFVLRHEIDGQSNRQYVLVEVTFVDYEPAFDDELFTFEPPEGANETPAGGAGSSGGARSSGGAGGS